MDPRLSVVVASFRSAALLDACLASLHAQCEALGAEIVVARAGDDTAIRAVVARYSAARMTVSPADSTIPILRAAGLRAATGDVVALTEDHCVAADGWLAALRGGYLSGADVVGGAMRNAQQKRGVDRGAYFSEYGFFAESVSVEHPALTGANVAYAREAAREAADLAAEGAWENTIHARLSENGHTLRFIESAVIAQNQNYKFRSFCRDRYEHGHDYARVRLHEQGTAKRWVYMIGSLALPFVLTSRVAKMNAPRDPSSFLTALPFTFAFLSAWSIGEMIGYFRGPAPAEAARG